MKFVVNLTIFIAICLMGYLLFSNFTFKEGLENANSLGSSTNGIAGSAAGYGANIKARTIKSQDELLISKYRKDYETVILNLDDFVNNLMLKTTLEIDTDKPYEGLKKLSELNQSKNALNSVMKFVDKS